MKGWALHERMAQCGVTVREVADLLGVHPHQLDHASLRGLPELPVRVLIDLARRLDLHPADLMPDLERGADQVRRKAVMTWSAGR